MAWYRVYFFGKDDHVRRAVNIECMTDADAVAYAEEQKHPFKAEVWSGVHLVSQVQPQRDRD